MRLIASLFAGFALSRALNRTSKSFVFMRPPAAWRAPRTSASVSSAASSFEEEAFWRGVADRPKTTYSGLKYTFMDLEDRLQNLEASVTSDEWRLRREFRNLEKN